MIDNKPFDHDQHCRLLEEAADELRRSGTTHLASAVETARRIHIDMQRRVAHARHTLRALAKTNDRLREAENLLRDYVTKPAAPWPGWDLFPLEKKDDERKSLPDNLA